MPHPKDPHAGADAVIKSLVDHYLHIDRLIWLRIPYLIAIDAAVWSGWYVLWTSNEVMVNEIAAIIVCIMGAIFTFMLFVIVLGAIENRDLNMPLLDKLLEDYSGTSVLHQLKQHAANKKADDGFILLFAVPEKRVFYWRKGVLPFPTPRFRAVWLFAFAFIFSIMIDLALIIITPLYDPSPGDLQSGTAASTATEPMTSEDQQGNLENTNGNEQEPKQ